MNNYFICPNCQIAEYFFDGKILKCPTCDQYEFESALYQSEANILYQNLAKLNQPYFYLSRGEIYHCIVEYSNKIEKTTVMPIIFDDNSNKVFLMFDVQKCKRESPKIIENALSKSFSELWNASVKNETYIHYNSLMVIGATKE